MRVSPSLLQAVQHNTKVGQVAVVDICGDYTIPGATTATYQKWSRWLTNRNFGDGVLASRLEDKTVDALLGNASQYFINTCGSIALIEVPTTFSRYLQFIGAKPRNMLKKAAKNGYACRKFTWNEQLDAIYDINTSKAVRQGRPMNKRYVDYPLPFQAVPYTIHYGCFLDHRLVAYAQGIHLNHLLVINTVIGHGDHLTYGVMNQLISFVVQESVDNADIQYINYLTMAPKSKGGLSLFKRSVGFRPHSCFFHVNKDCERVS